MAFPPLLCNYMPALLSSKVHITSVVINMCVRVSENVSVSVRDRQRRTYSAGGVCLWLTYYPERPLRRFNYQK